jgi:TRAP-type transport system small permease protein
VAAFSIILLQYAWKYTMVGNRQTSPAMGLKMSWVFASTFIFFSLVSLSTVLLVIKDSLTLIEKRGE